MNETAAMPRPLTELELEILNATADDAENLEQIYHLICCEYAGGADSGSWRPRRPAVPLAQLADSIKALVERGLLVVRADPAEPVISDEESFVWQAWFEPSPEGRRLWSEDHARTGAK